MHRVLGALVAGRNRNHGSDTAREDVPQLLAFSCRLLSLTEPGLVNSTSLSVAVSSFGQAEALVEAAHELAAAHGLIASVQLTDGRFRVRFLRLQRDPGVLSAQQ
jgi:hypothetical protein